MCMCVSVYKQSREECFTAQKLGGQIYGWQTKAVNKANTLQLFGKNLQSMAYKQHGSMALTNDQHSWSLILHALGPAPQR